jgi:hypothetical protein
MSEQFKDVLKMFMEQQMKEKEGIVYLRIPMELEGQEFDLPRGYGHARYKILGVRGMETSVRDAQPFYGYVDTEGEWKFEPAQQCFAATVQRLGGYDGKPKDDIRDLLSPYHEEIMTIRTGGKSQEPIA